jgi:hypothetical protein
LYSHSKTHFVPQIQRYQRRHGIKSMTSSQGRLHQSHLRQGAKPTWPLRRLILLENIQDIDHRTNISKYFSSHPATFLVKVLPVGTCCEDLSVKFPDSETQLTPAFIGGGWVCPQDCLRAPIDMLVNFSTVSETPPADLPLFIESAKQTQSYLTVRNYIAASRVCCAKHFDYKQKTMTWGVILHNN